MGAINRIFSWWWGKLVYGALLAVLGLAGAGLWIFLHTADDFEAQQRAAVRTLTSEKDNLESALADADRRILATQTRISAQQLRAEQAAKVRNELEDLSTGLDWLSANSDQLKENRLRMARMKEMESNSLAQVADLKQSLVRIQWEKDGMGIAFERNRTVLKTVAEERSVFMHYARLAWSNYGKAVLAGVVVLMLVPSACRLVRFWRS